MVDHRAAAFNDFVFIILLILGRNSFNILGNMLIYFIAETKRIVTSHVSER